jgi:hypothetical protein
MADRIKVTFTIDAKTWEAFLAKISKRGVLRKGDISKKMKEIIIKEIYY